MSEFVQKSAREPSRAIFGQSDNSTRLGRLPDKASFCLNAHPWKRHFALFASLRSIIISEIQVTNKISWLVELNVHENVRSNFNFLKNHEIGGRVYCTACLCIDEFELKKRGSTV